MTSTPSPKYIPRVALVTGAAQGIGKAVALRLANDGIDVAINDIPQKEADLNELASEISKLGRKVVVVPGSVADEEQVKNAVQKTVDSLGSLDIMVANAGIARGAPLVKASTADIDDLINVNLRGTLFSYKYAGIQMLKQGTGGRIIGASSIVGKKGAPNATAYSATKFAVRGLTQSFAMEMAAHNITVNAYVPGVIRTPMLTSMVEQVSQLGLIPPGSDPWAVVKKMSGLPENAPDADPEVIASLVSYLAKPESYFITGQSIPVAGSLNLSFD